MILTDIFKAVQKGKELSNARVWADRSQAGALLIAFISALIAIAKAFGYDLPVSSEQISDLAFGAVAVVSGGAWLLRSITDKRAGLPAKSDDPQ